MAVQGLRRVRDEMEVQLCLGHQAGSSALFRMSNMPGV